MLCLEREFALIYIYMCQRNYQMEFFAKNLEAVS